MVNKDLPGPFEGSQGTQWLSLHSFPTVSPTNCCLMMPRQCLTPYTSRSFILVSSSAVSTICGPGLAATATPGAHPPLHDRSRADAEFCSSTPDGLFLFSTALSPWLALSSSTLWRDMGEELACYAPRRPSMFPMPSTPSPNRAFERSNDAQRLSKFKTSTGV